MCRFHKNKRTVTTSHSQSIEGPHHSGHININMLSLAKAPCKIPSGIHSSSIMPASQT
jgi:hypothetical protein